MKSTGLESERLKAAIRVLYASSQTGGLVFEVPTGQFVAAGIGVGDIQKLIEAHNDIVRKTSSVSSEEGIATTRGSIARLSDSNLLTVGWWGPAVAAFQEWLVEPDFTLKGKRVRYVQGRNCVSVDDVECPLPQAKNEDYFAKAMFTFPIGKYADWSVVYRKMTGVSADSKQTKRLEDRKKVVGDTMRNLNKRICVFYNTQDELFRWKNKAICRNY